MPIEADLLPVIEGYLDSRAIRFPTTLKSTSGHGLSRWPTITVIPSNPIHTGERPALISGSRKRCGGPSASASSCSQAMSAAVSTRRNGVDAAVAAWRSKIDNAAHYMLEQLGPHANEPTAPGAAELSAVRQAHGPRQETARSPTDLAAASQEDVLYNIQHDSSPPVGQRHGCVHAHAAASPSAATRILPQVSGTRAATDRGTGRDRANER